MQRIDQELNRTLDLQRVVDLTVDNAIRESDADAGALFLVMEDPPGFKVVGSAGYPESVLSTGDVFTLDKGVLAKTLLTAVAELTYRKTGNDLEFDGLAVLPGSVNQLCVPLITGEQVTGALLLESTVAEMFSSMTAEHIQALAEHANTAISNAQLFARLGEANQARIKFVSIVAHELKQPITSIKGYAEVLLGGMAGALSERQSEFLSTIRRNSVRVQQLLEDLRDMTAQETGNLKLTRDSVNFNHVVLESVRPQQRVFDEKEQQVVLDVPDDLPRVWGDENRLIQIMTNFLSNANKYTPNGGTITIRAAQASNRWDPDGPPEVVRCSVVDTGIGLSEDDMRSMFKPYWRSSNPEASTQPGTGLGMSLTRGLIEAHGGRVWVESQLGAGTTFSFTLPLAPESERESAH
jgi:signal transduction histidine kinase